MSSDSLMLRTYGVKINVTDMANAVDFYTQQLGFEVESKVNYPKMVVLKSNDANKLILNLVRNLVDEGPRDCKIGLTLQVNDYDKAVEKMKDNGVDFETNVKRKEGVGYSIYFSDPFGTMLSIMQVTVVKEDPFPEPKIYNYGIQVSDMEKGRRFFKKLGFVERSDRYLPLDMPLGHPDNSFAFMLHYREGTEPIYYNTANDEHIVIMFKVNNLESAIEIMKKKGIEIIQSKVQQTELGRYVSFRDPFGMVHELIEMK
ncbi:MAG: VOC family protein [Cytophagales bacterium]|nr:VOC family protein [Cytophagales bacterium]